jgi:hypothetical protein
MKMAMCVAFVIFLYSFAVGSQIEKSVLITASDSSSEELVSYFSDHKADIEAKL